MKKIFTFLPLFLLVVLSHNVIAQNAGIRTDGTSTIATVIVVPTATTLTIPGDVLISGTKDSIINNGIVVISGNFTNKGNSFTAYANGIENFIGNTTVGGTKNSTFNNFIINPGAIVALTKSIDITNDWTNNGKFIPNTNQVSFSGTVALQNIFGSGNFYDLIIQNNTNFLTSKDTIHHQFSNSAIMTAGKSRVVFDSIATIIGSYAKNFYDFEIMAAGNVTHNSGGGNIHINNSYSNNGSLTEGNSYTIFFDSSGATENLSGTGTSTLNNITVGTTSGIGSPTTLNQNTHNFSVNGGSFVFYHSSIFNGNGGTVTFSTNNTAVSGTGAANFYNVTTNVALNLGASPTISKIFNNLQLNTGSSIVTNAPFYGPSATLIYNTTTASLPIGLEWNTTSTTPGLGEPYNAIVQNVNNVVIGGDRGLNGDLNIVTGNTLNINNKTLTLNGTVTGTGTLTGSTTSNVIVGSAGVLGTLYFNQATDNTTNVLKNFTINSGTASIGNPLIITPGDFAPNNFGIVTANGTLNANGNLTLRSGRYGDAIVGNSSGTIAGNVTVERFFPERRAWRFVTAPVNSAQTINAAWQEGVNNSDLIYANNKNPNPGYGTHITYDNNPANGYDYNTTTNPSIKYWDPAADNFVALPSGTNATNVNAYSGYYLFVRGSRAIDLSQGIYAYPYATVLRAKGTLNQTNGSNVIKNLGSLLANQYYLIGNPYASPVNLTHILDASRTTGYKPAMFWVWDPKLAGAFGVGAYVAYTGGIWAPAGGSYQQLDPPVIQSGQAFMVQANINSNISLDFREADKNTSEANVFGKQAKQTHPAIFTNLMVPSSNGLFMADGVATGFGKQFSAEVDQNDAQKLWNIGENIAQVRNEARLAIELRPFPVLSDTLFYKLFLRQQPYTLQIFSQDLPANTLQGWLIDKYLNTKTAVNLYDTTLYNFTPNTDTNSYRNRFMLVFNRTFTATPVPVTKVVNQDDPGTTGNAATIAETGGGVSIYPNPVVTGEKIMLRFSKMIKGRYEVSVSNAAGLALTIATIEHTGGSNTYALQTGAGWAAGSYIVKITGENGYGFTTKLVIGK